MPILGEITGPVPWPGFQNGRLLLPLPDAWFIPETAHLQWTGVTLAVKKEFHVTLLNQPLATRMRDALGDRRIRKFFDPQDWAISRTGDGALLRNASRTCRNPTPCASVIEHITIPALERFREALARAAGIEVPGAPAHVTLFAGGDSRGIGLPDYRALRTAQVATLRLPGIANRPAPPLHERQQAAYRAADYALDALKTSVRIGAHCPIIDAELVRRGVDRAAVVTAYNPFSARADHAGNELRQQWLQAVLRKEGLEVAQAEGRDPDGRWAPEPSLLAFGTTRELEARLLGDFEQHALVVVARDAPARLLLHPGQPTGHPT